VRQVDSLLERIAGYAAEIATQHAGLAAYAAQSLWLDQDLTARAPPTWKPPPPRSTSLRCAPAPRAPASSPCRAWKPTTAKYRSRWPTRRWTRREPGAAALALVRRRRARPGKLDGLARPLWLGGLTNSQGSLEPRLVALAELRRELFGGNRPGPTTGPGRRARSPPSLAAAIVRLDLPAYCAGKDELTDTVLMSILFHLDFIVDYRDRGAGEDAAIAMAVEAFASEWQQHCGEIDELVEVFGMVPDDCEHQRWDQMRGLLQSSGWHEVLRIRRLLTDLPELARIIRGLGRSRQSEIDDEASRTVVEVMEQAVARRAEARSVRVPDMPGETRGIHRSDRIARMLPAESILLGHPRLRLVWHARRAERTLLSYEDDDRMTEIRLHQALVAQPRPGPQAGKRAEQGPMLVCVDTSGSMQGGAEAVAKAVVLEAMRAAHAQRRPCHVFAFGGPEELLEMELPVDRVGIERVTRFLGQAFRGGTDICGPLEAAIAKLEEHALATGRPADRQRRRIRRHAARSPRAWTRSSASWACACRAC
jgi:hypothetical protein